MRGYSLDLRERVVKAVKEEKESVTKVAKRFGISRWTVNRYLKRAAAGKLLATKPPGYPSGLTKEIRYMLVQQVKEQADWTLEQHARALTKTTGKSFKKSVIGKYFKRLKISFKKDVLPS